MRNFVEAGFDVALHDPLVGVGREMAHLGHRVMGPAVRAVGWPGAFQPRAPTDPGVTVSSYRALVILITRQLAQTQSISSAQTSAGIVGQSPANTGMLLSSPAAVCTCCGSSVSSRH